MSPIFAPFNGFSLKEASMPRQKGLQTNKSHNLSLTPLMFSCKLKRKIVFVEKIKGPERLPPAAQGVEVRTG